MKVKFLKIAFIGLAALAVFSAAAMLLWNCLMPAIFGLGFINFWQALGLLALARLLFGGFGGKRMWGHGARHVHGHNLIREKWMSMTPEERKEFMSRRRFGHGPFGENPFEGHDSKEE